MKLLNEKQIFTEWAPMIEEKTGLTEGDKLNWITKYCHYHAINETYEYANLQNVPGMGNSAPPSWGTTTGGAAAFYADGNKGSGDKFPSLLPLAIQVAARTIGFDIVPVIPMNGPSGVLTYLDYVYAGGKTEGMYPGGPTDASRENPLIIASSMSDSSPGFVKGTAYVASGGSESVIFVGKSRIDGALIWKINAAETSKVSDIFDAVETVGGVTTATARLVKALEDHIQGYTGAGSQDTDAWYGDASDGSMNAEPMRRGIGEQTQFRPMGLQTFTKFVEAHTYQASAAVTTEQIQDLNRQYGIDVVGMVENSLVNEVSQSINRHILSRAFALGWSNNSRFNSSDGTTLNFTINGSDITGGTTPAFLTLDGTTATLPFNGFAVFGAGTNNYENQWSIQRRVFSKILAAGNIVSQRGRRGPANFLVTNLQLATVLQDASQFTFAAMANTVNQSNGSLYPVGSIAGITVYVDPNMSWNDTRVLVGRKGADEEPGLKFMPYLMAESIQTIAEGTMAPKIAVKSRYALVEAGFHPETQYYTFYIDTTGVDLV